MRHNVYPAVLSGRGCGRCKDGDCMAEEIAVTSLTSGAAKAVAHRSWSHRSGLRARPGPPASQRLAQARGDSGSPQRAVHRLLRAQLSEVGAQLLEAGGPPLSR